jgi:rieske iron-sulfur protein
VTDKKPTNTQQCSGCREQADIDPGRRRLLQAGAVLTLGLLPQGARADDDDPKRMMRPQVGDYLVRAEGDQEGSLIASADVKVGDAPVIAWAVDPATKLPRDGSRLNQVLLLRFDPASLADATKTHAADGLVAYSAICTHAQCTVSNWLPDKGLLQCPCHQSEYDPRQDAKVVGGPAPRALAALPLKIADGRPEVAGGFKGKVGMDQQMM